MSITYSTSRRKPGKHIFPEDFYAGHFMIATREQLINYFIACAEPRGDCQLDTVARANNTGHHHIQFGGQIVQPARLVLEQALGRALHNGYQVGHAPIICHQPACIRREHLMEVSHRQNTDHRRLDGTASPMYGPPTSRYVGVSWLVHAQEWQAQIEIQRKKCYLGIYRSEYHAALAYRYARFLWNVYHLSATEIASFVREKIRSRFGLVKHQIVRARGEKRANRPDFTQQLVQSNIA